ncbi:MAG: hypothetical protein IKG27_01555 [Bacilli bacterium]|nr:hypothetical protein [Bacilli bacterium]
MNDEMIKEIKIGGHIAVPLSQIGIFLITDEYAVQKKQQGLFPYETFVASPKENVEDHLLILQYLGNSQFLELISGHKVTDSYSKYTENENNPANNIQNMQSFQKAVEYINENPLGLRNLDEKALPLTEDVKKQYREDTLKNQDYIIETLSNLEKEAKKENETRLTQIANISQNDAEMEDVDRFIENHSRKI